MPSSNTEYPPVQPRIAYFPGCLNPPMHRQLPTIDEGNLERPSKRPRLEPPAEDRGMIWASDQVCGLDCLNTWQAVESADGSISATESSSCMDFEECPEATAAAEPANENTVVCFGMVSLS